MKLLERVPTVPGTIAGRVGGLSVAIVDDGCGAATVVTALGFALLTADECREAAAMLVEAADLLTVGLMPKREETTMADEHIMVTVDPVMVAMAQALADIDAALGLPDDGCNSTERTLDAVRKMRFELGRLRHALAAVDAAVQLERERCADWCAGLAYMMECGAGDGPEAGGRLRQAEAAIMRGEPAPIYTTDRMRRSRGA